MATDALPCIVCGKQMVNAFDESTNQPEEGLAFESHGHYGSTSFDPMDGSFVEVAICDVCLLAARDKGRVLYGRDRKPVICDMDMGNDTWVERLVGWCKAHRPLVPWTGDEPRSFDGDAANDVLRVEQEDIGAKAKDGSDLCPEITWLPGALK